MRIKMWGVRGSIPTPAPDTVEFGGNTSCYEVRVGGALIILDGGTGLRMLGMDLVKEMPIEAWMFFSHVHWDHIQGFPFFTPAFIRGNKIHLHGGLNVSRTLEDSQGRVAQLPVAANNANGMPVYGATPELPVLRDSPWARYRPVQRPSRQIEHQTGVVLAGFLR